MTTSKRKMSGQGNGEEEWLGDSSIDDRSFPNLVASRGSRGSSLANGGYFMYFLCSFLFVCFVSRFSYSLAPPSLVHEMKLHEVKPLASIPDEEITDGFLFSREELLNLKHNQQRFFEQQKQKEQEQKEKIQVQEAEPEWPSWPKTCGSYSDTDCVTCTANQSLGGCYWCPTTSKCFGLLSYTDCPDQVWIHDSDNCPLISNPSSGNPTLDSNTTCTEPSNEGCSDNNAYNYKIRATVDDGSCIYPKGLNASIPSCSDNCQCQSGGVATPYGKYCGKGYTGCSGEQGCDQLDRCCQIHDWCVGQEGFLSCYCNYQLLQCVLRLNEEDIASSFCPDYIQKTATTIAYEVRSILIEDCFGFSPSPTCGSWINCYGRGVCDYDGGCSCSPANGHFAYDQFNRTDCNCASGYGPPCGPDACTISNYSL